MRVLHLFSNWKVTGPAEPVIYLVKALRNIGVDALLAGGRSPFGGPSLLDLRAAELGVATIVDFRLSKHLRNPFAQRNDIVAVRHFIDAQEIDLVHCHMLNDHHIGGRAARTSHRRVPVLRSLYDAGKVKATVRNRFLLPRLTDGIVAFSPSACRANRAAFALPEERAWTLDGLVDLERFRPRHTRAQFRQKFDIPADAFVLGIVTRIQARRRFDLILEAVARARRDAGRFVFMVVGRGTHVRTVLEKPARALGITDIVRHVGYMTGEDYVDALGAMDAKIFLGGGTDETARAVREALAMGIPVIAGDTGMLPAIVCDGETGLVAPLEVNALGAAITRLACDAKLRQRLGAHARAHARERFAPETQAHAVEDIYRTLLERRP
jgi:glycosyltransferase involved in cell wall biosynthesis